MQQGWSWFLNYIVPTKDKISISLIFRFSLILIAENPILQLVWTAVHDKELTVKKLSDLW